MTIALECAARAAAVGSLFVVTVVGTLVAFTMTSVVLKSFFKLIVYFLLVFAVINHINVSMQYW